MNRRKRKIISDWRWHNNILLGFEKVLLLASQLTFYSAKEDYLPNSFTHRNICRGGGKKGKTESERMEK